MSEATNTIDTLNTEREAAVAALAEANNVMATEGPKITAKGFTPDAMAALAPLAAKVASATAKLEGIDKRIEAATRESRWAATESTRAPIRELQATIAKAKPMVPVVSYKGRVLIEDVEEQDGDATVMVRRASVTIVPTAEKPDLDAFAQQLAESIDVDAWDEAKITDVTFTASGIGSAEYKSHVAATASLNAVGKGNSVSDGEARSGALEYHYNGEWLGTRAFLEAVEASGHEIATSRARSFDVSLREPEARTHKAAAGQNEPKRGNGMSTFGTVVAKAIGVEYRAKAAAE